MFFSSGFPAHVLRAQEAMSIYSGDVVSEDVLKSFCNLLQGGDGSSAKKLDEDLDILRASKGGNVDVSKPVVKR